MKIDFDTRDITALKHACLTAPALAGGEIQGFMTRVTAHLQAEVQQRAPTTHGTLRASIFGEIDAFGDGLAVEGVVGTSLAYAPAVEFGTKPHHPPIEPLVDWARQKLALSDVTARRAAHAIAWKIARQGTKGAYMFRDALDTNAAQITSDFHSTVVRICERLGEAVQ